MHKVRIWVQGPWRRIFADDPAPARGPQAIRLFAARGETECFQAGIRIDGFERNFLTAEVSDLAGPEGGRIPRECVDVFYPECVPVKWGIAFQAPGDIERKPPAFFPDPLLEQWSFAAVGATAAGTSSVWVRVRVPESARPGLYHGTLSVAAGWRNRPGERPVAGGSARLRVTLRVWDFAMPRPSALRVSLWFYPHQLPGWYGVRMWSAEFWRLVGRFAADMAAHRQNVIFTPCLGGETAEDQMVGIARRGRTYTFDFSRFDRWCRLFLARGFTLVEGGYVAVRSEEGIVFWERAGGRARRVALAAGSPRFEGFLRQYFRALWAHLGRRGWRGRFVQHLSDEPGPDQLSRYRRLAGVVRAAAPGIRLIEALSHAEYAELVDIPVVVESSYQAFVARAGRPADTWVYHCCGPGGPWPNFFLEYLPVRTRILGWLLFAKSIPGFLRWSYNYWMSGDAQAILYSQGANLGKPRLSPWDDTTAHRWPGGDPMLVYPPRDAGMPGAIIGSIRWELVRESLEDYEYLRLTRRLAEQGDAEARRILAVVERRAAPDWTTHTRDAGLLESLRVRMGRLLERAGRSGT